MYGKLFASMFVGSLHGHWQAIVTFQQMVILADKDGTIEMTPQALSSTTSIPLDIIEAGIAVLEAPDPNSRTPDEEGRRIVRIQPERPWGWHITNHAKYRAIRTAEERREYHRQYWHKRKSESQPDSTSTQQNQPIAVSSKQEAVSIDISNNTETVSGKPDPTQKEKNKIIRAEATQVLEFLNMKTGKAFRMVDSNLKPIESILKSGVSLQDMKTTTARKINDWSKDPKMAEYLRPSTLYRRSNFEQYLGQVLGEENELRKLR